MECGDVLGETLPPPSPARVNGLCSRRGETMKRYLSFGGGVNSVALYLWLLDQGVEFEAIYADHGGDWPEVGQYIEMLQEKGYPLTVLKTERDSLNLFDYSISQKIMPSRQVRWCTDRFKVRPLRAYYETPCIVYLGISADESRRAKPSGDLEISHEFPLVEEYIGRRECKEIIEAHGLPLPRKSTCYFCPFQSNRDFVRLRTEHPELYCKVKRMEDVFNERRKAQGKTLYYLKDKPIDQIAMDEQADLFGERDMSPCLCEL